MAATQVDQRLVRGLFMDLLPLVCLSDVTKHDVLTGNSDEIRPVRDMQGSKIAMSCLSLLYIDPLCLCVNTVDGGRRCLPEFTF